LLHGSSAEACEVVSNTNLKIFTLVMKLSVLILLCAAAELVSAGRVTPITQVIELLKKMKVESEATKSQEQVSFAARSQFCKDTTEMKVRDISEAQVHMEVLEAKVEKAKAEQADLSQKVLELEGELVRIEMEKENITAVRTSEREDYDRLNVAYEKAVASIREAVTVLKQAKPQAALVEVSVVSSLALVPASAKQVLNAFLQDVQQEFAAPEAHAYEFQSGSIVNVLEDLLVKFQQENRDLETRELNAGHAHQMVLQDLAGRVKEIEAVKPQLTARMIQLKQNEISDSALLADTTGTHADDTKYTTDLKTQCAVDAADFEKRHKLMTGEIAAIQQALDILSGDSVTTAAVHVSLTQGSSLAQLRAEPQLRAVRYLQRAGQRLHSSLLSNLAVKAGSDPFEKVKQLIGQLITRLMEEATEEAEHKGWCDTELATNAQSRENKANDVESLTFEIDELEAETAQFAKQIAETSAAVAKLETATMEATKLRSDEKAENGKTSEDAKAAQLAIAEAQQTLRDFYVTAGESNYDGHGGQEGVLGMLEVIMDDFARLEAETDGMEMAAESAYTKFMTDSSVDKAQKATDLEHAQTRQRANKAKIATHQSDLQSVKAELDAANSYFEKLRSSCVDSGESAESRKSRREEEIQSLQEALRILAGEEMTEAPK